MMQIVFTKRENRHYSVVVSRCDLSKAEVLRDRIKLQFQGVGKKFLIPHDLSHFIVESKLNMRQGFWGCVADGALFPGMNILEGRQKPHAKSKSKQIIKAAHQQLRLAECLVRVFDEIYTVESDQILSTARDYLGEISANIQPARLLDTTILDVCSTLKAVQFHWQAMDIEQSIEFGWNKNSPSKSSFSI